MPRRILLLITDLEIGGTPTVVRELALRLRPFADVEVACLRPAGPVAEQIRAGGVNVTSFEATRPWHLPAAVRRLRAIVRASQINTVLSFLVHANVVSAIASPKLPGVRFIQSIQTVQPRPRWHWRAQAWAAGRCERLVVPSPAIVDAAVVRCGLAADRFTVIPNAIDPDDFQPSPVFTRDRLTIGFLGRIDPVKRVDVAIAASTEHRLLIFGDGPDRDRLKRLSATRVEWRGTVARPQDALREIDVLVLPSVGEGFGLVLIEAMAAGVPVVASAAGGILDVVDHERNGLLVPVGPDEVQGFASAVRRLRDDPALRDRLIAGGRAAVRERFNWDVVLPQYRTLLGV